MLMATAHVQGRQGKMQCRQAVIVMVVQSAVGNEDKAGVQPAMTTGDGGDGAGGWNAQLMMVTVGSAAVA